MSVEKDKRYTNFCVDKILVCKGKLVGNNACFGSTTTADLKIPGGNPGDVLTNLGNGQVAWSSSQQVSTINVGVTPTGIAITDDSSLAYVANNNNYGVTTGNYVSLVDLQTNLAIKNIQSGTFVQPYTATLSPDGSKVYITNSASPATVMDPGTISIIDTTINEVTGTITGFDGPSGLVINPQTNLGYVNNYGAAGGVMSGNGTTISVVNMISGTITATIAVDLAPAALALSVDGNYLYVANYTTGATGSGTVQVIDTSTNGIVATIPGFSGPFAVVVHPNGLYAYVTNFGSNNFDPYGTTVDVIDLNSNVVIASIATGIQPSGLDITPDGRYLYVSNYNTLYQVGSPTFSDLTAGEGTVQVIDTTTNTLLSTTFVVGQSPSNISISPDGEYVYVSNFTSNTVSVIKSFK